MTFGIGYFICAWVGQQLIMYDSPSVIFWLPSGLFVAALILAKPAEWPRYILMAVAANFTFDLTQNRLWYVSLLFCASNTIEAVLGAWLVRLSTRGKFSLANINHLTSLFVFAGMVSTGLDATLGALILKTFFGADYLISWLNWWSGDAVGVMVIAPLILAWSGDDRLKPMNLRAFTQKQWLELIILFLVLIGSIYIVFWMPYNPILSRTYLILPVLIAIVLSLYMRGITFAGLIFALAAVYGVKHGGGAFANPPMNPQIKSLTIQIFISTIQISKLMLAAIWEDRSEVIRKLKQTAAELVKAQHFAHMGSWAWFVQKDHLEWSDGMYPIFGIEKATFSGALSDVMVTAIHPEDRPAVDQANLKVMQENSPSPLEYRIIHPDGAILTVWAEAGELILDANKKPVVLRGVVIDITERKQNEQLILRLARLYRALSQVNQLITRVESPETLYAGMCKIMVEDGSVLAAWVGIFNPAAQALETTAHYEADSQIPTIETVLLQNPEDPSQPQPARQAYETSKTVILNQVSEQYPSLAHTRIKSWIAVPFTSGGTRGVMVVVSQTPGFFQEHEVNLVEEVVLDLEFALQHLEKERLRRQAEEDLLASEAHLKKALSEKETLLRELYHRTKNNMQVIQSMLVLHGQSGEGKKVPDLVKVIESKIQTMSLVHEMLYQSSNLSEVNLNQYIERLTPTILEEFDLLINLSLDLEPVSVSLDTAIPIGLILNEMLTNSCKYAFPSRSAGKISIRLSVLENNLLHLEYRDDGVGLSPNFDMHKLNTFGMQSIFALAERQLSGEIEVQSVSGIAYDIKFPAQTYPPRV